MGASSSSTDGGSETGGLPIGDEPREVQESGDSGRTTYTGEISKLLFVTARPGMELFWAILFGATFFYAVIAVRPLNYFMLTLLLVSYAASALGLMYFPYERWRPVLFFGLLVVFLAFFVSIVFFTGGRGSIMAFLFVIVPLIAAHYYSYEGTFLVALTTTVAWSMFFWAYGVTGIQWLSFSLYVVAFFVSGLVICYVVEGENVYAKEWLEYRRLLEEARRREREMRLMYELSRRFSYALEMDSILDTTASLAKSLLSSEGALVFLMEGGRPVLRATAGRGLSADLSTCEPPADEPWLEKVLAGSPTAVHGVSVDWLPASYRPAGKIYNLACVPLFIGADVAGMLVVLSPSSHDLGNEQLELLSTLAGQSAMAVDKSRLYSKTLEDKAKDETILSSIRDGLLVTDSRGVLVQLNPVARMMLSLGQEAEGRELLSVLEPCIVACELGTNTMETAMTSALEGTVVFGELSLRGEGNVTVQSHFIPLADRASGVSGMVLFLHDITELKRLDQMKSNFASNVSHELRTPLTSITGYVSLLLAGRAGGLTSQQEEFLKVVKEQSSKLAGLIEDLLDFSRTREVSREKLEPVDIVATINTAVESLQHSADEKDIDLHMVTPAELPPVAGQPSRLERVASNIIGNAIKFSEVGGLVEIGVSSIGDNVQISVSDRGIGIPASDLPHVFDRFFQARTGAGSSGGFGLGLAICREIVESVGGTIRAESEEGRGSTFYVTVPVFERPEG